MSTALLERWDTVQASLERATVDGIGDASSEMLSASLARVLGVSHPFGQEGRDAARFAARALVADLARLNRAAYCARHPDEAGVCPKWRPVRETAKARRLGECALLKALQCARYNCDAGEAGGVSDARGVLARLDAVIETLTDHIIGEMQEYRAAEWFF